MMNEGFFLFAHLVTGTRSVHVSGDWHLPTFLRPAGSSCTLSSTFRLVPDSLIHRFPSPSAEIGPLFLGEFVEVAD